MNRRRFEHLLNSIGVLRHPCDLDLILFFHRHPCALLTSERLAAYVGYDLNQVGRSLDRLTDAGLVERTQNPTHAARMYVLKTSESGWLTSLLEVASTREGRRDLIQAMREAAPVAEPGERLDDVDEAFETRRRAISGSVR
jgi:DNA-binding MarR family transcriptional regulator